MLEKIQLLKTLISTGQVVPKFRNRNSDDLTTLVNQLEVEAKKLQQHTVSGSVLSNEDMREPIENALYATNRFLTTQATDLADWILEYLKDVGFTIVRTDR